jgi:hypothetical protein
MTRRRWTSRPAPKRVLRAAVLTCLAAVVLEMSGSGLAVQRAAADPGTFFFSSEEVGTSGTTPSFAMSGAWTMVWNFSCADYVQGGTFSLAVNQPPGDAVVDAGVNASGAHDVGANHTPIPARSA